MLINAMGSHGEPIRCWPQLFHSYVMASGGKWQIILAVEQLLFLNVTEVTGVNQDAPGRALWHPSHRAANALREIAADNW